VWHVQAYIRRKRSGKKQQQQQQQHLQANSESETKKRKNKRAKINYTLLLTYHGEATYTMKKTATQEKRRAKYASHFHPCFFFACQKENDKSKVPMGHKPT
jgi:hypothetical protein